MTDVHEPLVRSYNMSQIRSRNTKPEMVVRSYLHRRGLRYSLHARHLPGKPDMVLRKHKTVIFIHGCFWHGHEGCKYFVVPKTNRDFWITKINGNKRRDKQSILALKKGKWRVIEIWECQLRSYNKNRFLEKIHRRIVGLSAIK